MAIARKCRFTVQRAFFVPEGWMRVNGDLDLPTMNVPAQLQGVFEASQHRGRCGSPPWRLGEFRGAERYKFLQKVRRDEGYRENEIEERLEALMEAPLLARTHALRLQNCWPLWEDEQVRNSLLDAIQAPNPERGKSLYVDEGPPPNHPTVRTAALGILVQLALDEAVREHMAQDTVLRESLVEALRLPPVAEATVEATPEATVEVSSRPGTGTAGGRVQGEKDEAEDLTPPIPVQSRAQQLLAMLVPVRACVRTSAMTIHACGSRLSMCHQAFADSAELVIQTTT
eukprot:s1502_g8.t1